MVPAAASLVTDTILLAFGTCAAVKAGDTAGVRSNVGGARVGLPDIHLVTADTLALDVTLKTMSVEVINKTFRINLPLR